MKAQPHPAPPAPQAPEKAYHALVSEGRFTLDPAQLDVLAHLQALYEQLAEMKERKSGLLSFLQKPAAAPQSLYIWGNVGRGKSMLMDLFFDAAPVEKKTRIHFHRFMQNVHARLHDLRGLAQKNPTFGDPMMVLVDEIIANTQLLCFDELQATDVADASLIFRLFEGLLEAGVVIVSTSNHPPASLYTGGVQKERFNKLTALLEAKMQVVALTSPRDYRMQAMKSLHRVYFSPLGKDADLFVEHTLNILAPENRPSQLVLEVNGRKLALTMKSASIACASFDSLCEMPLGPADYLAIAEACETLVLTGIPLLSPEKRNEAKRFVTLIDALYENKTKLICTAAAPAGALYPTGDGSFEFQRTVSRLHEMQSEGYLAA